MSSTELGEMNPVYGPFFGVMGSAAAMVFSALGAAYGTAKSGTGIAAMSVMRPELIMKSIIPVVSSHSLGLYSLILFQRPHQWSRYQGFLLLTDVDLVPSGS